jgi:hypothetical protein
MQEKNLRLRWKAIYILIALLGAAPVVACNQIVQQIPVSLDPSAPSVQANSTPTETILPTPFETPTQPPTLTDTPFPSPSSTATPTPICFHLLNPSDGSLIAEVGKIKFEWEPHSGAQKYLLEITVPDGHMLAFETYNASVERYLITLPWEGIYTWQVAAMNPQGGVICIVGPLRFSKPKFEPSPTLERNPPPPRIRDESDGGGG